MELEVTARAVTSPPKGRFCAGMLLVWHGFCPPVTSVVKEGQAVSLRSRPGVFKGQPQGSDPVGAPFHSKRRKLGRQGCRRPQGERIPGGSGAGTSLFPLGAGGWPLGARRWPRRAEEVAPRGEEVAPRGEEVAPRGERLRRRAEPFAPRGEGLGNGGEPSRAWGGRFSRRGQPPAPRGKRLAPAPEPSRIRPRRLGRGGQPSQLPLGSIFRDPRGSAYPRWPPS